MSCTVAVRRLPTDVHNIKKIYTYTRYRFIKISNNDNNNVAEKQNGRVAFDDDE